MHTKSAMRSTRGSRCIQHLVQTRYGESERSTRFSKAVDKGSARGWESRRRPHDLRDMRGSSVSWKGCSPESHRRFPRRPAGGGSCPLQSTCQSFVLVAEQADDAKQDDCSDECDEDRPAESAEWRGDVQRSKEPAAKECSADSDDDIADQPEPRAAHHERCEETGHESDDEPGKEIHVVHPGGR